MFVVYGTRKGKKKVVFEKIRDLVMVVVDVEFQLKKKKRELGLEEDFAPSTH